MYARTMTVHKETIEIVVFDITYTGHVNTISNM